MDNGFSSWGGYMAAKITKLEEQFSETSNKHRKTNLFSGISIFVNGLTDPSADELKRIMMMHGGTYHHYQRPHTTFMIASNLPYVKIRNMNTSKVISPQWVVDCVKENRIIDYTKYLLYTNHKPSQPKINFPLIVKEHKSIEKNEIRNGNENITKIDSTSSISPSEALQDDKKNQDNDEDDNDDDNEIEASQETLILNRFQVNPIKNISSSTSIRSPLKSMPTTSKSAVNPGFLSEFYNNSRLHHIATLGANFKQYISDLRENHNGDFPKRSILREKLEKSGLSAVDKAIMHIDMDCFFVSVGLRSYPELRGQPIAVTHSKGAKGQPQMRPGVDRELEKDLYMKRLNEKFHENMMSSGKADKVQNGFNGNDSLSEIASCSYEARKMGVKNGMFVGQALKLCPQLKTIPYDFEGYKEVAYTLYDTIAQYTLNIEAVSCDEMFVDLTDLLNDIQMDVMQFVEYIRNEVKDKTSCPCSAGVGSNRLQARMATKNAKPDGQFFLCPENVEDYMRNISISDLPGVGYSTTRSLKELDCKTCGDLQKFPLSKLQNEFGKKFGETLYQYCRGMDNRPLTYEQIRKSVSAEVNYGIRFIEFAELEKFLRQLCDEVHSRLKKIKRKGKCITLKLMIRSKDAPIESAKFMGHGFCDYLTKSVTLQDFTDNLDVITKNVLATIKSLNIPPKELRGIGIQITKLNNSNTATNKDAILKKENNIKNLFIRAVEYQKSKNSDSSSDTIRKTNKIDTSIPVVKAVAHEGQASKKESAVKITDSKKSPTKGKRRDRNPIKQNDKKISNIPNMLENFVNSKALKRPSSALDAIEEINLSGIDSEIFSELPEDIKKEVIRDYAKIKKIEEKIASPKKLSKENDMKIASSVPHRKEIEKEVCLLNNEIIVINDDDDAEQNIQNIVEKTSTSDKKVSDNNIFIQKNCEHLIAAWVESADLPEDYDVEILTRHACELISDKNIYDLYDPLVFLKSMIIKRNSCGWHKIYKRIIDKIQLKMKYIYGAKLFLDSKIDCDKCN